MATYYADFDLTTGNNDGTTWANAWQTMQRAVDGTGGTKPVANDTVYCRGIDTLAITLDLDGDTGSYGAGMVKWIGVNSSGVNDGTRAVIDGNAKTYACAMPAATDFWFFENFEFKQMSGSGIDVVPGTFYHVFVNCSFNNNTTDGIGTQSAQRSTFIRCTFYSNGNNGVYGGTNVYIFCSFHSNTMSGVDSDYKDFDTYINCLFYDNGDDGIINFGQVGIAFGCVFDGNTDDGIVQDSGGATNVISCRITNHSGTGDIGLDMNNRVGAYGWNYFENNDGANVQNSTYGIAITDNGSATNVEDTPDTDYGYENSAANNFSTRDSGASLRRAAVTIPTS